MIGILIMLALPRLLVLSAAALDLEAPAVPDSGADLMPGDTSSFGDALWELAQTCLRNLYPDWQEAAAIGIALVSAAVVLAVLGNLSAREKRMLDLAGAAAAAAIMLSKGNVLIRLAAQTIQDMTQYGKLLLPVMTAALAAQGGVTASAALCAGTSRFGPLLSSLLSTVLLPCVYLFLAMAVTWAATGEKAVKQLRDLIKSVVSWCLKTLLTVFTTYMSITGAVSGTTDAAVLKAAKVTISSAVPVVGGILSDASETVLVSAGLMKNSAGVYGILACLSVFLGPFLRIGVHYWVLKIAAVLCGVLSEGAVSSLAEDFSTAMGLLLAMTASVCVLLLVSTVCFMKGVA